MDEVTLSSEKEGGKKGEKWSGLEWVKYQVQCVMEEYKHE